MAHTVLDSVVPGVEVGHRAANYRVSRTGAYPARRWLVHGGSEDAGVGRRGLLSDGRPQRTPRCLTPQGAGPTPVRRPPDVGRPSGGCRFTSMRGRGLSGRVV